MYQVIQNVSRILVCLAGIILSVAANAQNRPGMIIDQIVGVVGDNVVMQSEVEMEFSQLKKEFPEAHDSIKCEILKQRLTEKVMLAKAQVDSVELSDDRVEQELDRRIAYFASQVPGGVQGLEEYYGKSIAEIKATNREKIREGLLVQEVQQKALKDVHVTPNDIKKFYNEMAATDSLPFYSAEVEVAQIIIEPKVSAEAKQLAFEKIQDLRARIMSGEDFATMALIYSEDKGSAVQGGELGFFGRGAMVPEFEAAAFRLKPDSISKIIETQFGYHILKLINRKGDNINIRHILIRPQIFKSDIEKAREKMDSVIWLVKVDTMSFEKAAKKFSDDNQTKASGGFITESGTGTTRVPIDELDKSLYFRIENMQPGDMLEPELITLPGPDRQQVWRVLYLKSETAPHRANLRDDYQKFQVMAENKKKTKALADFINRARKQFYMSVADAYKDCPSIKKFLKD